jgi:hypothetical protein
MTEQELKEKTGELILEVNRLKEDREVPTYLGTVLTVAFYALIVVAVIAGVMR